MLCRGFLLGGTSGRTTLNGEGPQHQDGHSQLVANTVPNMLSYDPAFAYELAVIVHDGLKRMYEDQENVFYYITVHNQNYPMPPMPDGVEDGIRSGMYCYQRSASDHGKRKAHLFGSGAIMSEVLRAAELLESRKISTDIWSVTSYNELSREALRVERQNLFGQDQRQSPYVESLLADEEGVFVAASDYMKDVPLRISRWVPEPFAVLGTDGFGLSESRDDLRGHFEVSAEYIAYAAVSELNNQGVLDQKERDRAIKELNLQPDKPDPATY